VKTKRINATDLSQRSFLWAPDPENTKTWLLPVCDLTSAENTKRLIERSLNCWDMIAAHIPESQHRRLRAQLEGAATSHGIAVPDPVTVTDDEMVMLLAERLASRVLADLDSLYLDM
jgi:hypothetical protein